MITERHLDMLILKALSASPMHGYGVGQRIGQLAEEMLKVEEGSLYPALYWLEEGGWIKSEWGKSENNRRALLQAEGRGAQAARRRGKNWCLFVLAVGKVMQTS